MFETFRTRLIKGIRERLDSTKYRYIDNSVAYYLSPCAANMAEDKEWFRNNSIPDATAFLRDYKLEIEKEVLNKGLLFSLLADSHSRETLLLVALYALLGRRFVKFPYYSPDSIELRKRLALECGRPDVIPDFIKNIPADPAVNGPKSRYAVSIAGEPVELYTDQEFLYQLAALPAYRYQWGQVCIGVRPGDFVLDCGACYGDTALMFAAMAGDDGQVLSFEPNPDSQRIFMHNCSLNPRLSKRLSLASAAVCDSNEGDITLSMLGPGSRLGAPSAQVRTVQVPRTTLDREIEHKGWEKVDFIKMDIEGAELGALRGATGILRRFRPRLAICLYHNPTDFLHIPRYLHDLDLGYKFYLEHHFINGWETVLYAECTG